MPTITSIMYDEHQLILKVIDAIDANVKKLESGEDVNPDFYKKVIDFVRNYADKFHHAKEEDILFEELKINEITRHNEKIQMLLHQHILGRMYIGNIEKALEEGDDFTVLKNAKDYSKMLRDHIDREDNLQFPMIEESLPEIIKKDIVLKFIESDKTKFPAGTIEKYQQLAETIQSLSGM